MRIKSFKFIYLCTFALALVNCTRAVGSDLSEWRGFWGEDSFQCSIGLFEIADNNIFLSHTKNKKPIIKARHIAHNEKKETLKISSGDSLFYMLIYKEKYGVLPSEPGGMDLIFKASRNKLSLTKIVMNGSDVPLSFIPYGVDSITNLHRCT